MAKKLEEECGTKVLMNVPEVDQVDLSAFSEGKAKETRRFMRVFRRITGHLWCNCGGLAASLV